MAVTLIWLATMTQVTGATNYGEIVGILISKRAQVAAEAAIFLFTLCVCSAFLVVVVDSFHLYLQRLLGLTSVQSAWQMSLVIGALVVLPFSLPRRLENLSL